MKEELIRIENGEFQYGGCQYQFDVMIAKGECIGVYVDDHISSGTAYLGIFNGNAPLCGGKAFALGEAVRFSEMERWIRQNCMIINKHRFTTKELNVWDFVTALGKSNAGEAAKKAMSKESERFRGRMDVKWGWDEKLYRLSMLDYYLLAVYKGWLWESKILVLDRITEILRRKDLEKFMACVQLLLEQGTAVFMLDLDEESIYQYANRVDVVSNRRTCYRLYPEEYDERIYKIVGYEQKKAMAGKTEHSVPVGGKAILEVSGLQFEGMPPLSFQIQSGEIAFLRDENYNTVSQIRACFLERKSWKSGTFRLGGKEYRAKDIGGLIGKQIGLQVEMPDRRGGVLFDNLTALENLTGSLIPKAGKRIVRKSLEDNVLDKASEWFERDKLLKPLSEWPLPEKLRLSYYKWYLIHPMLLVCLFPFAGQETVYHERIMEMLAACAKRGMGVWMISSGIDAICERTGHSEFWERLRFVGDEEPMIPGLRECAARVGTRDGITYV